MPFHMNPQTGQLEDENGNPVGPGAAVPMDQMQAAGPPVGMVPGGLAANQRAGRDLSMPVVLDRGGNDAPLGLPLQTPGASAPAPITPTPTPGMVRDTSTTTRQREVPLPQEAAAMRRVTANDEAAVGVAQQQGGVDQAKAQQELEAAQARQAARQGLVGETQAAVDQGQATAAAAKAKYDAESEKLSGMKVQDFWADKGIGSKVVAAIALAMGAVGGALTGKGGNVAMDVINKSIDDDYRLQRAKIDVQARKVEGAKEGIQMARQSHADQIADLELTQAAKWNAVGDAAATRAAQVGTQAAAVQAQRIQTDAQQKRDLHLEQWLEGQRAKVTSTNTSVQGTGAAGAGGKSTEAQQKLALLAQQMNGELDTIQKNPAMAQGVLSKMQTRGISAEAADATASKGILGAAAVGLGRAAGVIPKSKYENMTDQEQLVANAWDNATEKYARVLTGAGMPEGEARRLALQDAPHAGDSPVVIAQKFQRMRAFANQSMSLAGPAATAIAPAAPGVRGGAPAAAPSADDQAAIQWANSHPGDPRARRILQMHGM